MMLSFSQRFLFYQCWQEHVVLEVASLLASGTDLGLGGLFSWGFLGIWRKELGHSNFEFKLPMTGTVLQ